MTLEDIKKKIVLYEQEQMEKCGFLPNQKEEYHMWIQLQSEYAPEEEWTAEDQKYMDESLGTDDGDCFGHRD